MTTAFHRTWLRAWDVLAWTLVAFPLITGGLWFERPGLKVELSQLAIPVVVVGALGYWLARRGVALADASVMACARKLGLLWSRSLEQSPARTLLLGTAAVGAFWAWASLRRHWALGTGAADLGIFTNAIWNLAFRGEYVSSVKDGIHLLTDHQSPIFWLWAPIFRLLPYAETLLVTQAFVLAAGAPALWCLARPYLARATASGNGWMLAALPWLYWAYPAVRTANAFDFHPEITILPLFLWGIAGVQGASMRSRILGVIALALGLMGKESAGPVLAGIGLAWIAHAGPASWTVARARISGTVAIVIGVAVFLFDTRVVPGLLGGTYVYDGLYASLLDPEGWLTRIMSPARWKFLLFMLAPIGFLPLLGWRAALASVPGFLMLFLSEGDHRVNPIYHYGIEPAVGLLWALPLALARAGSTTALPSPQRMAVWLLICALAFHGRSEITRVRRNSPSEHAEWIRSELLPTVAPMVSLSVSGSLVPHLATRPWVHHLPHLSRPQSGGMSPVDCAIVDPSISNWPLEHEALQEIDATLQGHRYEKEYRCGALTVWRHPDAPRSCLTSTPFCP